MPTEMKFDTVVVGAESVCGLSDRVAYCRGWNGNGSMGSGDTISSAEFTRVETDLRFRSISHGRVHVCGLTDDGEAYCWGWGRGGRLGNGTADTRLLPTPVAGGHRFLKLAAGGEHHRAPWRSPEPSTVGEKVFMAYWVQETGMTAWSRYRC